MFWLSLIVGIQFLGFGITLGRLAYDEWQQWRASRNAREVDWGLFNFEEVQAMEKKADNVIPIERGADARLERRFHHFSLPHEVVCAPDIDMNEKRSILAAWASDEHAVESMPTLRYLPGTAAPVTFSSIMEARAYLDRLSSAANDDEPPPSPSLRRPGTLRHMETAA